MKNREYVPERQDIVWIDFMPSKNEEIRGRHPAVVLSTSVYTRLTGLAVVAPITHASQNRLRDFFISLDNLNLTVEGFINPLQFFTFSIKGRHIEFSGDVLPDHIYVEVRKRVIQIIS